MQRLPIIIDEEKIEEVSEIVEKCIELSNEDWDSFETSWDFIEHPVIKYKSKENNKLINDYKMLESDWDKKFKLLKNMKKS